MRDELASKDTFKEFRLGGEKGYRAIVGKYIIIEAVFFLQGGNIG